MKNEKKITLQGFKKVRKGKKLFGKIVDMQNYQF